MSRTGDRKILIEFEVYEILMMKRKGVQGLLMESIRNLLVERKLLDERVVMRGEIFEKCLEEFPVDLEEGQPC